MTDPNYVGPEVLARLHPHPRDGKIGLDQESHVYSIVGHASSPVSVTTVIKRHFEPFDADAVAKRMIASANWSDNPLFGSTVSQIKAAWRDTARLGTDLHRAIEIYYNEWADSSFVYTATGDWLDRVKESPEYRQFLSFVAYFKKTYPDFTPYRTEWVVFDEKRGLAGTIDMTFINGDGKIMIVDWKRSKNVTNKAYGGKRGTGAFKGWPDSNYYHYAGQLNLYRSILESCYSVEVVGMYLVVCHPDQENFRFLPVNPTDMRDVQV